MKRKNSSDHTVERVYNFILNCGGIVGGSVIAKSLHISESWAQQCAREAMRRYGDIESISGVGYGKKGIEYSYNISANLYSEEMNDYIHHWDGPVFKRLSAINKAEDIWNTWFPPEDETKAVIKKWRKDHPCDYLEIEIGLWDGNGDEVEFYNMSSRLYE